MLLVLSLIFLFAPLVSRSPDYASGDRGRTIGSMGQAASQSLFAFHPNSVVHPSIPEQTSLVVQRVQGGGTENAALTGGRAAFWMGWGNESTSPLPKPLHSLIAKVQ